MAWFESHQTRANHPKTHRLMRLLEIRRVEVLGHLDLLYYWVLDYAPTGDLSRFTATDIADAADWPSDPARFVDALVESGFLDRPQNGLHVHDWLVYCGEMVKKRLYRDRLRSKRAEDIEQQLELGLAVQTLADVGRTRPDVGRTSTDKRRSTVPNLNLTSPDQDHSLVSESINTKRGRGTSVAPAEQNSAGAPPKTRPPDLLWDALADIYGETQTPNERGARNAAVKQFREGARSNGKTEEEIARLIPLAHAHWGNVMGDATETPLALAKHFGLLLAGPQIEGRDAGRSTERRQGRPLRGIDAYIDIVEQEQEAGHAIHRSEGGGIVRGKHGPSHGQLPAP